MKILKRIAFITLILFLYLKDVSAHMENYCTVPPFLSTYVSPNVLFAIDVSGSMSWSAYNPHNNKKGWCDNTSGCGWTYTDTEEGYFVPDKVYKLVGDCNSSDYHNCHWEESISTSYRSCPNTWQQLYNDKNSSGKHYQYKGSCLNFLLMSRIDLLRWAITGGRPVGCSDSNNYRDCDPDIACTGSLCMLEAYWGDKVLVPKERIKGILQILEKNKIKPRFGALFFSGSNILRRHKIYIGDYLYDGSIKFADSSNPYTNIKRLINYISPSGSTPSAGALWEAYDYFKQEDDHPIYNDFSIEEETFKDPMYVCDENGNNCKPIPCAKNYVILASDGQWNTNLDGYSKCTIKDGYQFHSADPVVPAYHMHKETLRTIESTSGISFDIKVDRIYTLGLFLGGTGEQSLKNVAIYGSFDTQLYDWPHGTDGSSWNGSGSKFPWETCYMDDCGNGRGSACTPLPPSSPDWDADGDGNPDTFLNAKNASEIKNALLKFIGDILKRTASGTSISVLAEKNKKGATIVQAVFYPEKRFETNTVSWIGYLYQYWFLNTKKAQNTREDTNENRKLDILQDLILQFNIDSSGNLYIDAHDSDSYGNPTSLNTTYFSLDEVHPLWEAGEELSKTEAVDRTIYAVAEDNTMKEFVQSNVSEFDDLLGYTQFPECLLDSGGNPDYEKLINYIRGEDFEGCRSRKINDENVWKLADIIYSSPITIDYKDFSVTFVGANDGMLHAFSSGYIKKQTGDTVAILCDSKKGNCGNSADVGKELWAFIPKNVMPYLRYYADQNYCHIYTVDLSPYFISLDIDGDGYEDKKIIIGGFRLGGACGCTEAECINPPSDTCSDTSDTNNCIGLSSYFALDITDIYNPKFLWEFTSSDLGFSYSGPAYIKRKTSSDTWKHFVMFASGPTTYEGHSSQPLRLFILDLLTGNLVYKYEFPSLNNAFGGKLFTNGLDVNQDGQTDYVFLGYTKNTGSTSQGGVIKIWTGDIDPAKWDYDKQYFNMAHNPITAKVEFTKCFGKWYTFFGTGRYFYKEDEETSQNALYGVPFLCDENNSCETGEINSAHNAKANPLPCEYIGDKTKGAWMIPLMEKQDSYLKERNISNPTISDFGAVFFTTTRPTADTCGFGGLNRSWALNCATGSSIIDTTCPGASVNIKPFKYIVQLSGGNIKEYSKESFTQENNKATEESYGIPGEKGGRLITPSEETNLRILLWLEK